MLPYTPLHTLLFAEGLDVLVMTSGNPSDEPLCWDNAEALDRLNGIADGFLLHDRDIERGVDDSVLLALDRPRPAVVPIRRARGYVPAPIHLQHEAVKPVLALGGELKSTVCLLERTQAVLSEHLGDLSNARAYRHFVRTARNFQQLLQIEPAVVACDLHPDYASTRYARSLGMPVEAVQHHHAHVVSCMADNGITGPVVGIACDGTGYGTDGAIWGGEVLIADERGFRRVAQIQYFPLLGGDAGARETWRPAAGLLHGFENRAFEDWAPEAFGPLPADLRRLARRRLEGPARLVRTSSLGRVFDAAAFLLGLGSENRYEAEAAMRLESAACRAFRAEVLPFQVNRGAADQAPAQLDIRPALVELIVRRRAGQAVEVLARAFHETIATMLAEAAIEAARHAGLRCVVLSGGCFINRLLSARVQERVGQAGLEVHAHRQVPPGDGGLSLGQAVVAACRTTRRRYAEAS